MRGECQPCTQALLLILLTQYCLYKDGSSQGEYWEE